MDRWLGTGHDVIHREGAIRWNQGIDAISDGAVILWYHASDALFKLCNAIQSVGVLSCTAP